MTNEERRAEIERLEAICASDTMPTPNGRRIVNNREKSHAYKRLRAVRRGD